MARTARLKRKDIGSAYYHLMSRTNDQRFLFVKGEAKTQLVSALRRAAAFSGIALNAYTALDNHFHVVCKVTVSDAVISEDELIERYAVLKGRKAAEELAEHWGMLRHAELFDELDAEHDRLRRRMNDISEFIKTFKEEFDRWFKKSRKYCGSIWSGRFKSTLIESGEYLSVCKRYVVLNPVRAGIVTRIRDYRWSWCEDDEKPSCSAGPVPSRRLMRRIVQIGEGRIFGSREFVMSGIFAMGDRLKAKWVTARAVMAAEEKAEMAYASHGWKLAKEVA